MRLYYWRDLPLRGASRRREGGGSFLGSSRCAGLPVRWRNEALSGGAPAARGCSIEGGRRLYYWGISRCAGLPVRGKEEARS